MRGVMVRARARRGLRDDERSPLGGGGEYTGVADGVEAWRRDGGGEAAEQGEGVEVDGDGAVAERLLEGDAHEAVGAGEEVLGGERRAEDVPLRGLPRVVFEEGFASLLVVGPCARGGVQAEAELADGERRGDDDAGTPVESELDGAAAELGAGGREPGDGGRGELG
jgi:hypothetical protein